MILQRIAGGSPLIPLTQVLQEQFLISEGLDKPPAPQGGFSCLVFRDRVSHSSSAASASQMLGLCFQLPDSRPRAVFIKVESLPDWALKTIGCDFCFPKW